MTKESDPLSHFDSEGNARMVDVGEKPVTERWAVAEGWIRMGATTLECIRTDQVAKGDVLGVARIAGIQGAKWTAHLVPLCHTLPLTSVEVAFHDQDHPPAIGAEATVKTVNRTGAEMEALSAVNIALLTIYDMTKAMDRSMTITDIRLHEKAGGQSGYWHRNCNS